MKRFLVTEEEKKYIRNLYNLIVEHDIELPPDENLKNTQWDKFESSCVTDNKSLEKKESTKGFTYYEGLGYRFFPNMLYTNLTTNETEMFSCGVDLNDGHIEGLHISVKNKEGAYDWIKVEDKKSTEPKVEPKQTESPTGKVNLKPGVYWFIWDYRYDDFYKKDKRPLEGWNKIKNVCDGLKIYNEVRKYTDYLSEYKEIVNSLGKVPVSSFIFIVNDKNEITTFRDYIVYAEAEKDSDEIIAAIKTTKFTPTETTVPKVNPTEPNVTKEPEKPKQTEIKPEAETQTSEKSPEAQGLIGKNITLYRNRNNLKDKGEVTVKDIQENPQNGHVTITVVPTNTFQGKGKEFTLNYKCENVAELKTPSGKTYFSGKVTSIFFKKYCELVANKGIFNKPKN